MKNFINDRYNFFTTGICHQETASRESGSGKRGCNHGGAENMSGIVVLRATLDALNNADSQKPDARAEGRSESGWDRPLPSAPADDLRLRTSPAAIGRAALMSADTAASLETLATERAVYFDDDLDSESVRLLALKAQQQLSIQALAIANVQALSIIGLFRDDDPPILLM